MASIVATMVMDTMVTSLHDLAMVVRIKDKPLVTDILVAATAEVAHAIILTKVLLQ